MISLRARLALLLVVAISTVVALATTVSVIVLGNAGPSPLGPIAAQVRTVADLAAAREGVPTAARPVLQKGPAAGERLFLTDELVRELALQRSEVRPIVTRPRPGEAPVVSIPIGDRGWITMPYPDFPSPGRFWRVLIGWMLVIVTGTVAVALFVARRMTRPLLMLEDAVAKVGPDGLLPVMPEEGPPEVRQTAAAFNRLSQRLRQSMDSRMRLVAAAGHDLRTPMTRMRLRVEFLEDEERSRWLSDLNELDRIADSAIRLVREEAEIENAEPVALDRLLGDLAAELQLVGHKVTTGPMAAVTVKAGPLAIKRALQNLAINAATHGGGAEISLSIEGQHAIIRIEDDGPGIPPELLSQVFDPFFRVDPARRQSVPGAGLGLAIAREIIERNGGTITIENKQSRGLRQMVVFEISM